MTSMRDETLALSLSLASTKETGREQGCPRGYPSFFATAASLHRRQVQDTTPLAAATAWRGGEGRGGARSVGPLCAYDRGAVWIVPVTVAVQSFLDPYGLGSLVTGPIQVPISSRRASLSYSRRLLNKLHGMV